MRSTCGRHLKLTALLVGLTLTLSGCGGSKSSSGGNTSSSQASEFLYAEGNSDIRSFTIDLNSGKLTQSQTIASTSNTTTGVTGIVATSPANYLYAIDPTDNGVEAFSVGTNGTLSVISGSPFQLPSNTLPGSLSISGLAVSPSGSNLYALNGINKFITGYRGILGSGALTLMPSPFNTGTLTRPEQGIVDPSGQYLYVSSNVINVPGSSSGSLSGVLGYSIDSATGNLTPLANSPFGMPSNGQPTQLAFDPTGHFLYVVLTSTSSIAGFVKDPTTGELTAMVGSPFLSESSANLQTIAIAVHPSGMFLYALNVNAKSLSAFTIDSTTGALSPIAGSPFSAPNAGGTAIGIDPSEKYLYVTAYGTGAMSIALDSMLIYSVNATTGALSQVSGSPVAMPETIYNFTIVQAP